VIRSLLLATAALIPPAHLASNHTLTFGVFGRVTVYRPSGAPTAVALFFSGDGGWTEGVVDMARAISGDGVLVLGVDTPGYLRRLDASHPVCVSFAEAAEALSQYAEKALGLLHYQPPMLLGYSSGAGLVYAALAQAPDNTFQGAVSIGFDPLLPTRTPACERNGLRSQAGPKGRGRLVSRVLRLPAPWIVLHGELDRVSPIDSARAFVASVRGGELEPLPSVGHGFSKQSAWLPRLIAAVRRLSPSPSTADTTQGSLGDLPLVTLPVPPAPGARPYFALVLSGDGGWASIDKQISEQLVAEGVPTVGLNSLQYFWKKRSPDEIAADLARIIRHYQAAFDRPSLILVGYSRGADVLPLMASRLPSDLLDQVRLLAYLGLERETDLEFRLGDWLGARHQGTYRLLPELEKLRGRPMLCIFGEQERGSLCPELPSGLAEKVELAGGHHFGGDYRALVQLILDHVR